LNAHKTSLQKSWLIWLRFQLFSHRENICSSDELFLRRREALSRNQLSVSSSQIELGSVITKWKGKLPSKLGRLSGSRWMFHSDSVEKFTLVAKLIEISICFMAENKFQPQTSTKKTSRLNGNLHLKLFDEKFQAQ
jgi:hypothetical protein